jgi:hypothetical protein
MFADPITITIAAVPKTLARISTNGTSAVYQTSDGAYTLNISHQITKDKIRTLTRLDYKKVVADPLTAVNDYETHSDYTVQERPNFGFSDTEVKDQLAGFQAWLGLAATQDKLFNRES